MSSILRAADFGRPKIADPTKDGGCSVPGIGELHAVGSCGNCLPVARGEELRCGLKPKLGGYGVFFSAKKEGGSRDPGQLRFDGICNHLRARAPGADDSGAQHIDQCPAENFKAFGREIPEQPEHLRRSFPCVEINGGPDQRQRLCAIRMHRGKMRGHLAAHGMNDEVTGTQPACSHPFVQPRGVFLHRESVPGTGAVAEAGKFEHPHRMMFREQARQRQKIPAGHGETGDEDDRNSPGLRGLYGMQLGPTDASPHAVQMGRCGERVQ